ncbi:phospholipase d transphosphatidylase protein [Rutstroemia sp. NJR-2017a BBW]|nr:phospholipase d transphosphatidylase protein [Rutstroemia sp. NJR-2017a BBW]
MTTSHPTFSPTLTHPTSFHLGTGHALYTHLLPQLLRTTQHSLVLVTCFWASSPTSHLLSSFLRQLSAKATTSANPSSKIHIRICVSSLSALQKAFHTSSPHGTLLTPETLGLPALDEIPGVDLRIKSIFLRPCHVLHGKYIIQDGRNVWFPSANNGDGEGKAIGLAEDLLRYWEGIWDSDGTMSLPSAPIPLLPSITDPSSPDLNTPDLGPGVALLSTLTFQSLPPQTRTLLLPHPHSPYNPLHIFLPSILFSSSNTTPPPTPLNTFLLTHVSTASHSLQIYTPNLTYRPLITALEDALQRGVNIRIVLPRKMMVFEQLLTAGTLSEIEVWRLRRRMNKVAARRDEEMGRMGGLEVVWFDAQAVRAADEEGRPTKLHLKLTIIDDAITVLGSGNMDRASWVTSQEVGVAVFSEEVAKRVGEVVRRVYG